ncbi:MAG TPA: DsbA family protein [Myxococcota bacterium]|nr:DsbA family protein [Myxococcota bacterium]
MESAFYYDIVCPYAYMAFSLLRRQNLFKTREIELRPILLGGLFKLMEQDGNPNATMPKDRALYIKNDIKRQAKVFGIPLEFNPHHPQSTLKAMRILIACPAQKREALSEAFFKAYWQDQQCFDNEEMLYSLAEALDARPPNYDEELAKELLKEATFNAFKAKVFGVPTLSIDNRLYFGSDRLFLIRDRLGLSLPDPPWGKSSKQVDFYFDFSSPYSYLAHAEIEKAEKLGVKVNYVPILLGALFKERGVANVPLLAAHPNKASYFYQDMKDWAKERAVPFVFNSAFPLRSVTALRVALIEPRARAPIFEAAWALNKDIGDIAQLTAVLEEAGLPSSLLKETEDQRIKDKLKENTARAFSSGIFGVPTFKIDNELVFGQDRFLYLKAKLL